MFSYFLISIFLTGCNLTFLVQFYYFNIGYGLIFFNCINVKGDCSALSKQLILIKQFLLYKAFIHLRLKYFCILWIKAFRINEIKWFLNEK